MERLGLKTDIRRTAPPPDGTYEWPDPRTGEILDIPKGVDPGWDYDIGHSAWGKRLSKDTMNAWKSQGAKAWERLTPENWENAMRPEKVPIDAAKASLDHRTEKTAAGMAKKLREILGGAEKTYSFQSGTFRYDMLVNAEVLASHVSPDRAAYLSFLPETMEDPYEVWLSFEQHKGTGKVALRQRIIKAIKTGESEGMLVVTQSLNGFMESWTMVPTSDMEYLNRQRVGRLIWKR